MSRLFQAGVWRDKSAAIALSFDKGHRLNSNQTIPQSCSYYRLGEKDRWLDKAIIHLMPRLVQQENQNNIYLTAWAVLALKVTFFTN